MTGTVDTKPFYISFAGTATFPASTARSSSSTSPRGGRGIPALTKVTHNTSIDVSNLVYDAYLTSAAPREASLLLILKWGGELTPSGRFQAEELGKVFRCMYPGGQGESEALKTICLSSTVKIGFKSRFQTRKTCSFKQYSLICYIRWQFIKKVNWVLALIR